MPDELSTSWHSYPKIYAMGHRAVTEIFDGNIVIEEKIDGSQFSFGKFNGELKCRSKGQQLDINNPEKMFNKAVQSAKDRFHLLMEGWTYRTEYLKTPKHNTLKYDRIPECNLIIFDINHVHEGYVPLGHKLIEAKRIGLECVPSYSVPEFSAETFMALMNNKSILGGSKIEGFVVKNYDKFGDDKKALMAKYVTEEFKEMNKSNWKATHPGREDLLVFLEKRYRTEARWAKAVQHLKEGGHLDDSPKDIGKLLMEVKRDTFDECADDLKEQLYKWAMPRLERALVRGFPEWYKQELMKRQFEK